MRYVLLTLALAACTDDDPHDYIDLESPVATIAVGNSETLVAVDVQIQGPMRDGSPITVGHATVRDDQYSGNVITDLDVTTGDQTWSAGKTTYVVDMRADEPALRTWCGQRAYVQLSISAEMADGHVEGSWTGAFATVSCN